METFRSFSATENVGGLMRQLHGLATEHVSALLAFVALTTIASIILASHERGPPAFWDPIPFIYNSIQYLLFNEAFMVRVKCVSFLELD